MALIDSLNPAVAGLRMQERKVEVAGDNIANVDTPGFKSSRVEFSTVFSQVFSFGSEPEGTAGGVNPVQVGRGGQVAGVSRDFNQGVLRATGVNSDLAIDGDGFFIVGGIGTQNLYTRDGTFGLAANDLLVDPSTGGVVQGWLADTDFNISTDAPITDVSIPVGSLTIARETSEVLMQGILNSSGDLASSGTRMFSLALFDASSANQGLISAANPLGLDRATAATRLEDLVISLGDFTAYTSSTTGTAASSAPLFRDLQADPNGLEIVFEVDKGDRKIDTPTFTTGEPPPAGGATLGDLVTFIQDTFGITDGFIDGIEQAESAFSHPRVSPVSGRNIASTLTAADTASLSSLTIAGGDFRGVQPGDFIRFTSGHSAGQIAEITSVSDSDGDNLPDTLGLRIDGFNSLTLIPEEGDTYSIHAPAGVDVAIEEQVTTLPGASFTAGAVGNNGAVNSFTITGAVTNFAVEHGVEVNQRVEWLSGGATVEGWITGFTDTALTVSYDAALGAQTPDPGTAFTTFERLPGSIDLAGNAGEANGISEVTTTADGELVSLFTDPAVAEAAGESVNTSFTVFDSLGGPHEVEVTFVYESASANGPNVVRYYAESSSDADLGRVIGNGSIIFNSQGQFLTTGGATETVRLDLDPTPTQPQQGVTTPLSVEMDFSRLNLLSSAVSDIQLLDQDGFPSGTLIDFAVGADGVVEGIFDNGLTRSIAQVAIARFQNPNGLILEGNNYYRSSGTSGAALTGEPGTLGRGRIRGGALEESNVDLAAQFTELITGQRAFQANARTFTVSDQMLQELVNLI